MGLRPKSEFLLSKPGCSIWSEHLQASEQGVFMQFQNFIEVRLISSGKVPGDGNPAVLGEFENEMVTFSHLLSGQIAAKWVIFVGVGTCLVE
jgi:hypothetical protein